METELALDQPPSSLSRRLALIKVRDGGVGPGQVRFIATDPEIFEAFYREHVEAIQGFVARRVGDWERAADLTAEIFLAAIGAAHRYRAGRGSPKAWLYGIAQNVVAIDRRRSGREHVREERLRGRALVDEGDATEIDARIDAASTQRDLYRAMDRLSETERAVLELVALDELSLTEAAAAAGVRPVTARVRLHRARRKLRAARGRIDQLRYRPGRTIMKENRNHDSRFEERLLDELKSVVAQRGTEQELSAETASHPPGRRRAPRLALGAAAVCAAAAALLIVNTGSSGSSKAFAVEPQEGGGVTISIYSAEDSTGLEGALAEAGIRSQVTWLPAGMTCSEPRFTPSRAKTSGGGTIGGMTLAGPGQAMTIGVMSPEQWEELWNEHTNSEISDEDYYASTGNISLDPAALRSDQTVVIFGSRGPYGGDPEGGFEAQLAIAEGPVAACDPVKVPAGRSLESINDIIESEAASAGKR